jgi:leucyl aminopeptidase
MDFRTQVTAPGASSRLAADALLVLVAGDALPAGLDEPVAAAVGEAVKDGDLRLEAGKSLYLHRLPGVKAGRVAVAAVGAGSAKTLKAGVLSGLGLLKSQAVKHLAVQIVGLPELQAAHAEAVAIAVGEGAYLYRTTKPSAPAAPALQKVSLLAGTKDEASVLAVGLARGAAIADGVALARERATTARPPWWPPRPAGSGASLE